MSFEAAIHAKAIQLDQLSLQMTAAAGSGHPTSAMSLGHIVTVLLYNTMRWSPDAPGHPSSDRLVLSEGHAVPIVYAALADLGVAVGRGEDRRSLTVDDLSSLRENDSVLDGHPNPMEGFPFFDAATGSLGQGLSVAGGIGVVAKREEVDRRIYCIIGDGEAREGQVAEAIDFIIDHNLNNVLPIFNCNEYGQAGQVSQQQSAERMAAKLEASGFTVRSIDGHDPSQIKESLDAFTALGPDDAPIAIVAKTVKGWGAASLQGGGWHGKPADGDKLEVALEELRATGVALTSTLAQSDDLRIYPPSDPPAAPAAPAEPMVFEEAMKAYDMDLVVKSGRFATRKAYGVALRALGHVDERIWALDADVRNSTFADWFATDRELESRFVDCKIAEQNMYSAAVGLSAAGKIPFCSTFAKFVTRGYDQIEMAINSGANIKIVGSHAGISLAADGPSQMSLPDVAWFRSLSTMQSHFGGPGCYVLQPADAYAAYGLTLKMAEHHGACYMRTHRPDVEFIYDDGVEFELGGHEVLTEGRDLLICTAGYMVHECNAALDKLDRMGIDATLVDLYSIPFDAEELLDLANQNNGKILTVEDNYGGGLGSAVADAIVDSGDAFEMTQLFVKRIPKSARSEEDILKQCKLHHSDIVRAAARMLGVPATV
ncbi:MAG: transketolase [Planctomycetota bacterium]